MSERKEKSNNNNQIYHTTEKLDVTKMKAKKIQHSSVTYGYLFLINIDSNER